ncbi:MAG: hypothetical protein KGH67_06005, partial [Candidatus Micrarchaeota archaeon]|nr:hypothetical protein [Candidatus Micrarchaeota archaeon]
IFKTLGQGVCALSYINTVNNEKVPVSSVLAKIPIFMQQTALTTTKRAKKSKSNDTQIQIIGNNDEVKIEVFYLNEKVFAGSFKEKVTIPKLLERKVYELHVLAEKKKDAKVFRVVGGIQNTITLQLEPK